MRAADPRLLRHAGSARWYLALTVALGLAGAVLILLQADLLSRALAGAARGTGTAALSGVLAWLGVVVAGRAAAAAGGEAAALRAAAAVKSALRRRLTAHALRLGPQWLGRQRRGEITTLATRGLDGLDAYFARYLPRLVLGAAVPLAVLARVAFADWISAVIIAVTLPLIPLFAVLIGWHTRAQTQRQWQSLARLGGHFLDVVAGLPTLKLFGRSQAQAEVIQRVTGAHRQATMATLRVAFMSALALELTAALATALVAVEIGLRLLGGHVGYQTALLVLLLTPEAFLPLRNASAEFHASADGSAAARRAFEILDTPLPGAPGRRGRGGRPEPRGHRAPGGEPGVPRPGTAGPGRRQPDRPARRAYPPGRPERRGQELATGPAAPLRRAGERDDHGRWCRPGPDPGRSLAGPDRLGSAAPAPVRHVRGRQHRPGRSGGAASGHRGGRAPGRGGRFHPAPAARLRHHAGRRGPHPVRRAAAEDRAGPGVPAPGPGPAARRAYCPSRSGQCRRDHDGHPDPDGRSHRHPRFPPAATSNRPHHPDPGPRPGPASGPGDAGGATDQRAGLAAVP